jgi:hypothetical protein
VGGLVWRAVSGRLEGWGWVLLSGYENVYFFFVFLRLALWEMLGRKELGERGIPTIGYERQLLRALNFGVADFCW